MTTAIIDRKKYDTDAAEEIASWSTGKGPSDFAHCYEALYLTENGSWFFEGAGAAEPV